MSLDKRIIIPLAFTICMLVGRIILTKELVYIFLAWNLFLAWIPFAISGQLAGAKSRWRLMFLAACWLLFLPNAPYIITDFMHLKHRAPIPYWYDILLLFSAALNGLLLGLLSLVTVEKIIKDRYGSKISGILILCSFFLCAFGIYMGRYLRWNSWDILMDPGGIGADILDRLINPFAHVKTWAVTLLFGSFLYIFYYSLKNFINTKSNHL